MSELTNPPQLVEPDADDEKAPKRSKKSEKAVIELARKRLAIAIDATSESREYELDDLKFAAGSPDNNWQWPTPVVKSRSANGDIAARPCLTINKLPQHIKQVTNDQQQNRPSGKVIPASDDAHSDVAELMEGLVRRIEYVSSADIAYDIATENAVTFGEGYFRIITKYADEDSFDQDIFIESIRNSFSVYMDPMIKNPTGEDAKWCLLTEDVPHDEYEEEHPDAKPISSLQALGVGNGSSVWIGENTIRIAEYFCYETTTETLNLYSNGKTSFDGDPIDKLNRKMAGDPVKTRKSERKKVKWYKTNGFEILEEKDWAGKYIPVVRVVGNEFEVEGKIYVSGIVRNAKDAQRMYNYWTSQEAEMLALAPKAPFIGAGGQFEGFENKWGTANTVPYSYLEYNPEVMDGNGNSLPPPQRAQPPMVQSGLIAAKNAASEDIKETTGQYNASLGQTSNERSGKAILARQHEGDVSTYHYVTNVSRAIRFLTRQLIDLIPKIFDTTRVALMMGEDGETTPAHIDPANPQPVTKIQNEMGVVIKKIYNPNVGKYDVIAITGPGYATKRQEALEAMANLLQNNPELWKIAGDLFVKNMDWPGAQELAKRFAKTIDPKLTQNDDDPALQQAQQQIQQLDQELQQAHQMIQQAQNSIEAREIRVKEAKIMIERFDAETRRLAATAQAVRGATQDKAITTPEQIQDVVLGTIHAAVQSGDVMGTIPGSQPLGEQPPQEPQQGPPQMPQGPPQPQPAQPPGMAPPASPQPPQPSPGG